MEDLLPILIGIIWVAITLYNKGKKKKHFKQPDAPEIPESKSISVFEQILMGEPIKISQETENYFQSDEANKTAQEKNEPVPDNISPLPFLRDELAQFTFEGQSVIESAEKKTIEEFLTEQEVGSAENDFEIRKAIIYSEILNAPYIHYK